MEAVVANVDDIVFDIEVTLREQLGAQALPFSGMDSEYMPGCDSVSCDGWDSSQLQSIRQSDRYCLLTWLVI